MTTPFAALEEPTAAELNMAVQKLIAYGRRETSSSTTTTEIGVMRLSASLKVGYRYLIYTGNLNIDGSAANNNIGARLRYTIDGSTPSITSTILQATNYDQQSAAASEAGAGIMASYAPVSDITFIVLLTVAAFVGAPTVGMLGSGTQPIELFIENLGPNPGDTGVDI